MVAKNYDRFSIYKNFEVINEDVLKVNLNEIIKENKKDGKIKNGIRRVRYRIRPGGNG